MRALRKQRRQSVTDRITLECTITNGKARYAVSVNGELVQATGDSLDARYGYAAMLEHHGWHHQLKLRRQGVKA